MTAHDPAALEAARDVYCLMIGVRLEDFAGRESPGEREELTVIAHALTAYRRAALLEAAERMDKERKKWLRWQGKKTTTIVSAAHFGGKALALQEEADRLRAMAGGE